MTTLTRFSQPAKAAVQGVAAVTCWQIWLATGKSWAPCGDQRWRNFPWGNGCPHQSCYSYMGHCTANSHYTWKNVWLDKKNNPICLTKPLQTQWTHISPDKLWSDRNAKSDVNSKETQPHKGGPHNSTSRSQDPPSLDTPTSPIPTNQNIDRDFVQ